MIATGIGSLPGTDMGQALARTLELLPDLGYLPELPSRGPGAGMIGRAAALLVDLPVELMPSGWRLTGAPSRAGNRARSLLRSDADQFEQAAADYPGQLKVSLAGPWTLAAALELSNARRVLSDSGARRELVASWTAGCAGWITELDRRLGRGLGLQIDEPLMPAVLGGRLPTESGLDRYPPLELAEVSAGLAQITATLPQTQVVLHCCAPGLVPEWLNRTGIDTISLDARHLAAGDEAIGEWLDAGRRLWLGVLPTHDPAAPLPGVDQLAETSLALLEPLGLNPGALAGQITLTPACGLAGFSQEAAELAQRRLVSAARDLDERLRG